MTTDTDTDTQSDDAFQALVANLVRACDEYNLLRGWGNSDTAISERLGRELAKFPDQDRVLPIGDVARQLAGGAAAEAKLNDLQEASPMRRLIDRLLGEAPQLLDGKGVPVAGQTPALECVVMFASGQAVRGALSKTPEGTLRMLSVGQEGDKPVLVEQFFEYEAALSIALMRAVSATPADTRIILPKGGRVS